MRIENIEEQTITVTFTPTEALMLAEAVEGYEGWQHKIDSDTQMFLWETVAFLLQTMVWAAGALMGPRDPTLDAWLAEEDQRQRDWDERRKAMMAEAKARREADQQSTIPQE